VAAELGIGEVVFPRNPGTLSAYGILFSDLVQDIARSRVMPATAASLPTIAALLAELRAEGMARLARDGVAEADRVLEAAADMRYHGQAFELLVRWPALGAVPDEAALAALLGDFHAMHRQRFSYADEAAAAEIVTLRIAAIGRLARPDVAQAAPASRPALKGMRRLHENGAWCDAPVYDREALGARDVIEGPAIIEEAFATHVVSRGWRASLGAAGALVARREGAGA
jgi:N-methylhydantoinase A/oxoprolinase/acetone carboxylase beta subunit